MPEVRRFLYDSVLADEYKGLSVKFISGAAPQLILYDSDDQELSREVIQDMSFDAMHALVQSKGFVRVAPVPEHDAGSPPPHYDPYDDPMDEADIAAAEIASAAEAEREEELYSAYRDEL